MAHQTITARITVNTSDKAAAALEVRNLLEYAFEVSNDEDLFASFVVPPQGRRRRRRRSRVADGAEQERTREH